MQHLATTEAIKAIADEYGWSDFSMEQALACAIRLWYIERGTLVEVEVNLRHDDIAVRRRSGYGESGVWLDVDSPMLPPMWLFMETMEIFQWGDGAPGRVLEGEVAGYRDGGIFYRVTGNRMVYIAESLLAVSDQHNQPEIGSKHVMTLCASRDQITNMRMCTRRGPEFVTAVMESYFPDCISAIWMGASNSWAVVRMKSEHMTKWLENGGVNIQHVQAVMGVRRITLLPEGEEGSELDKRNSEIRHYVNNSWRECTIAQMDEERVVIHTPKDHDDPRKYRTFVSMLKKIVSDRDVVVM